MTAPSSLNPKSTVLFLGSGFSKGARNSNGDDLVVGDGLRNKLADHLKVPHDAYDLRTLADEVVSEGTLDLANLLHELFSVSEPHASHRQILGEDWLRIYTTNYDDLVEFCTPTLIPGRTFSYNSPVPRRIPHGSVIHLHGAIRDVTTENVLDQVVLNEKSYVAQHFDRSPWYNEFLRDLKFCDAIYFVGYSLNDYHISALLMQNPQLAEKTYFIKSSRADRVFSNRVAPYGSVLTIGTDGFAELCKTLPRSVPLSDLNKLHSFRFIDPFKDKKSLQKPSAIEILNLVAYGTFVYQRCLSVLPKAEYVAPRQADVDEATKLIFENKSTIIHGRLGNGKTIFSYLLAIRLSELGYRVFRFLGRHASLQEEIDFISKHDKVVFFFDDYDDAVEMSKSINESAAHGKFVVFVRTGTQEVRSFEIQEQIPKPVATKSLNFLTPQDRSDFGEILDFAGIRGPEASKSLKISKDFRDFVLDAYKNRHVRENIRKDVEPLLRDLGAKKTFVASHLLRFVGQPMETSFLRMLTGQDPYLVLAAHRESVSDLFRLEADRIEVRSGVLAEHILEQHVEPDYVLDVAYDMIVAGMSHKHERKYRALVGNLMQFSNLNRLLSTDVDHDNRLESFYEKLRRDTEINREPLFWLQYSILMTSLERLDIAMGFVETAYDRAEQRVNFRTYQIDTHALKLSLRMAISDEYRSGVDLAKLIKTLAAVGNMLGDSSDREHAINVLEGVEPFIRERLGDLNIGEKNLLVYELNRISLSLSSLSDEIKITTGSDLRKASIDRAIRALTS